MAPPADDVSLKVKRSYHLAPLGKYASTDVAPTYIQTQQQENTTWSHNLYTTKYSCDHSLCTLKNNDMKYYTMITSVLQLCYEKYYINFLVHYPTRDL